MRLPRRSPFHDAEREIPQLYQLLYPHSSTPSDRQRGVDLVQEVYLPKGGCPVAIECTASLVSCIILDDQFCASVGNHDLPPHLSLPLRQTLSLSLIRLVNSLSDSLQTGPYARSIAHIAESQLGMPSWFVEFRHRATHEDLPSLEVCRSVVGAALGWLEGVYWRPMMSKLAGRASNAYMQDHDMQDENDHRTAGSKSTSDWWKASASAASASSSNLLTSHAEDNIPTTAAQIFSASIATLEPVLLAYKRISKLIARDESLRGPSRMELQGLYAEMDRWISRRVREVDHLRSRGGDFGEGKRARFASPLVQSDAEEVALEEHEASSHQQVFHLLFAHLLQPGGIIPLSKAKRAKSSGKKKSTTTLPPLPEELLRTWSPLLMHLTRNWEGVVLGALSAFREATCLQEAALFVQDKSYRATLYAWTSYFLSAIAGTTAGDDQDEELRASIGRSLSSDGGDATTLISKLLEASVLTASTSPTEQGKALLPLISYLTQLVTQLAPEESNRWAQIVGLVQARLTKDNAAAAIASEDEDTDMLKGFDDMQGGEQTAVTEAGQVDSSAVIEEMQSRYEEVLQLLGVERSPAEEEEEEGTESKGAREEAPQDSLPVALPLGWSIPSHEEWTPRPIGCL